MLVLNLKALVVVVPLIFGAFLLIHRAFAKIIDLRELGLWRNAYIFLTLAGFLVPNFWAMMLLFALTIMFMGNLTKDPPSIFALLLCSLPAAGVDIPGFGGINYLLNLSPQLVVATFALIPCLLAADRMKLIAKAGGATDVFFSLYILLLVILSFRDANLTHGLRGAVTVILFALPQYFVFSRWFKNEDDVRKISAVIAISMVVLASIAIGEFLMRWHFYAQLPDMWGALDRQVYSNRGGFLRTYATILGPIAFGFMLMIGIMTALAVLSNNLKSVWVKVVILLLAAALVTTLARGPWFGTVIAIGLFVLLGPKGLSRSFQLGIAGLLGVIVLLPTSIGQTIIGLIPFIGDSATETISYRQELWDTGVRVMMQTPLFGSEDYLDKMQSLIQGQGIIDIVNSYLRVGLDSGLSGLGLFLGIHFSAILALWSSMNKTKTLYPELSTVCRAYFSLYIGALFVLATTSSVAPIGTMMFVLAGISIGLHRVVMAKLLNSEGVVLEVDESRNRGAEKNPVASKPKTTKPWQQEYGSQKKSVPKHLQQYTKVNRD